MSFCLFLSQNNHQKFFFVHKNRENAKSEWPLFGQNDTTWKMMFRPYFPNRISFFFSFADSNVTVLEYSWYVSSWCIPSSSWSSLASKYLVLPHFVLCLKILCLLVLHWIVLSHLLFYFFGLLPLRPHILLDLPFWSFSILSSLVFVLYHMVL